MKYAICEVEQFFDEKFDEKFDGTFCRVSRVLQIFDYKEYAEAAMNIFDPSRYGDYDTVLRIVSEAKLDETFR